MIFRRPVPRNPMLPRISTWTELAPEYLCERCQVRGRGSACWFCSSKDVTFNAAKPKVVA